MAEKPKRVEIGFSGGQVVAARLASDAFEELKRALPAASGWHELKTEEGDMTIDLRQVVFVRTEDGEHRVGFINP